MPQIILRFFYALSKIGFMRDSIGLWYLTVVTGDMWHVIEARPLQVRGVCVDVWDDVTGVNLRCLGESDLSVQG